MSRLLGLHVNSLPGGLPELLAAWRPPLVVTLVPGPVWSWLHALSPRTLIVYRHIEGETPDPPDLTGFGNLSGLARARVDDAIAAGSSGHFDYLQLTNEPHIPDATSLASLARWEAEAIRYAAGKGIKLAIGNFSVGNPANLAWWDSYIPALEAGREHGSVLNLHEYNYPQLITDDAIWYNFRHRQVYAHLAAAGLPTVPLILGECGLDAGTRGGGQYGSWQGHVSAAEYARQLEEWDLELQAAPYVLGAAVYMAGQADGWWAFNVYPEPAAQLAQSANPLYRTYTPPLAGGQGGSLGADFSWWQGPAVDWTAIARSGVTFAILRASCGLAPDSTYSRNWTLGGNKAPKIRREAYHYVTAGADSEAQALTCLRQLQAGPVPAVWADLEDSGLTDKACRTFVETLSAIAADLPLAPQIGIYTSWYKAKCIKLGKWAAAYPLWVADWRGKSSPLIPEPWSSIQNPQSAIQNPWTYWQYTVAPSWPGVPGRLDLNRAASTG